MYSISSASNSNSGPNPSTTGDRRVRVIRLVRSRRSPSTFGFSLRGGHEHATGFFVSKVEFNSEALRQGLKVGDQVIAVNGHRVDDAVHSELMHYLNAQSKIKLKVRYVGMVPVKESMHESLTWQYVGERTPAGSVASSSPTLCYDSERGNQLRLSILVPPRSKLGCGICKGPDWKPGIFVQFVRDGGLARDAGLRPGDQIMSCNGFDFTNISFNEAVAVMKATGRLELIVREGVGAELVSPESSGYNSSTSSAAGERSPASQAPAAPVAPPAALRRRLASVAEEAADRADRLNVNRVKRKTWNSLDFEWKDTNVHNFDIPSDIEPDYDCPSIPNNPYTFESKKKEFITKPSNRTIINLTEDGATIHCTFDNKTKKNAFNQIKTEEKTVKVEVHMNGVNSKSAPEVSNNCSNSSLSSAIAEEIQRRRQSKKSEQPSSSTNSAVIKNNLPKTIENAKKTQHDALLNEFKKVHRKMFGNQDQTEENSDIEKDEDSTDRKTTVPLRKEDNEPNISNGHTPKKEFIRDSPPPPPPMPKNILNENGDEKEKIISKIQPIKPEDLNGVQLRNGNIRTPTPDYNKNSIFTTNGKVNGYGNNKVEQESEFKTKHASLMQNKTTNHFTQAANGQATMKKLLRPVSVTIGEYNGEGARKQPSKLNFLNGDMVDGSPDDMPLTNRLQSELALTLSRSNLRRKTDTLDIDKSENSYQCKDKYFRRRYGDNIILPLSPTISIPKVLKMNNLQAIGE